MATNKKVSGPFSFQGSGRFAYDGLNRVIHEKARLSIVSSLATHPHGLVFNDLKELCALTDGNLSRHLQILSDAGLVQIWKGYKDNRPQTLVQLTDAGRKRFVEYIAVLENVVTDAVEAAKQPKAVSAMPGWTPG